MSPSGFAASEAESKLADILLDTTKTWQRNDSLSVDAALRIFQESGISFKEIREIWSLADEDDTGRLTKDELIVAIRLMGWVQAGFDLNEDLLRNVGPLPTLKGINDTADRRSTAVPDEILSPSRLDGTNSEGAEEPPPGQTLSENIEYWDQPCLSENIESMLNQFKLDLEKRLYICAASMTELTSAFNLPQLELVRIWNFATQRNKGQLSSGDITFGVRLTRIWLAGRLTQPTISSSVAPPKQCPSLSQPSIRPDTSTSPSSCSIRPTLPIPSGGTPPPVIDIGRHKSVSEVLEDLSSYAKSIILRQMKEKKEIQVANEHLKRQIAAYESELRTVHEARSTSIPIDVHILLQDCYMQELSRLRHEREKWEDKLNELRSNVLTAQKDADSLRATLATQSEELASTKQRLSEVERESIELSTKVTAREADLRHAATFQESVMETLYTQIVSAMGGSGTLQPSGSQGFDPHSQESVMTSNLNRSEESTVQPQPQKSTLSSSTENPSGHLIGITNPNSTSPSTPSPSPSDGSELETAPQPFTAHWRLPRASRPHGSLRKTKSVSSDVSEIDEYDQRVWEHFNEEVAKLSEAIDGLPASASSDIAHLHRLPTINSAATKGALYTLRVAKKSCNSNATAEGTDLSLYPLLDPPSYDAVSF